MEPGDKDQAYFGYYGLLAHQQNMLQDTVRTALYHTAITGSAADFAGKVVLDVGCGSGVLSFFAAAAHARKVYAVEAAAPMAEHARALVRANGLEGVIEVITGKVEDIAALPEPVDIIVSEPMGVLLVHERMLESFLVARDRFLRPAGAAVQPAQMYPAGGEICFAPFSDAQLYAVTHDKARFWKTRDFYGIDLSALRQAALDHYFGQAIVSGVDPKMLLAAPAGLPLCFATLPVAGLRAFAVPLDFAVDTTGICHGLAAWFDVAFLGACPAALSTAPAAPRTHWHQVRLLLRNPLALNRGQRLTGTARFTANGERSYTIDLELGLAQEPAVVIRQTFQLHDQVYWNLGGETGLPDTFNMDYLGLYPEPL